MRFALFDNFTDGNDDLDLVIYRQSGANWVLVGSTGGAIIPMSDRSSLRRILETSETIAMVGASSNPSKPSYEIMKGLLAAGFTVIPVNPTETEVLGQRAYPSLEDIPERVDIVNVFRRPEQTPEIADAAVKIGARVLWLQTGIVSEEAARRARAGGLEVVMDECLGGTTARLRIRKPRS